MKTLEWLSKRLVEAIVMAVFVGTIVISLLAISGEFGETERIGRRAYPDNIVVK